MIYYKCLICNEEFKSDRKLNDSLLFCKNCRETHKEYVRNSISEVNRKNREEKKKYWEEHPDEYKKFLEDRKKKAEESKIKKYGSLEKAEEIRKQKQLETLKKKYPNEDWSNITNVGQIKEVKEKIKKSIELKDESFWEERAEKSKETKINKYGSLENAYAISVESNKKTMMERYGVSSSLQLESTRKALKDKIENDKDFYKKIKEKTELTKINKYGSIDNAYKSMVTNLKNSCIEKYGVDIASKSPEISNKIKNTYNRRKETEEDFIENIQKKTLETKINKYGSLEEASRIAKEKREKTNIEKYGASSPFESEEIKEKIKNTLREKYNIYNPSQLSDHKDKMKKTISSRIRKFEENNNCTNLSSLVEKFGQGWLTLGIPVLKDRDNTFISNEYIHQIEEYFKVGNSRTSHDEKDILSFIKSIYNGEVIENIRTIISPLELDIYIPDKKIAIEYNGNFWHSTDSKDKKYHENKSILCEEKGIRLIHIYECEWLYSKEKIKSLLRIALGVGYSKIGARKCEVRKISNKEAKEFNDKNHLQNHRNSFVTYGLFYNGELQQLMSFSKTRYNRNLKNDDEWEIIRGCPASNNQIIGGVSKLFSSFVKEFHPKAVFSYCDFNKFDGRGYEALGMKFIGLTGPDKFYVDKSGAKINRNPSKRKELEKECIYTIYGAGSKKYMWREEENA